MNLWGDLTILAAVMALVFATCVFVYISRLENRTPHPLGEKVGAHKAVLAKIRKREPMSQDEVDYASELVTDARSPLAYAIPATLFTIGLLLRGRLSLHAPRSTAATRRSGRSSAASRC